MLHAMDGVNIEGRARERESERENYCLQVVKELFLLPSIFFTIDERAAVGERKEQVHKY
jgi:hypothetical protein